MRQLSFSLLVITSLLVLALPASAQRWTQVSVGDDHACALDAEGRVYCWGNNHAGQLGARTPEHCGIVSESGRRGCYATASDTLPLPAGGAMRFRRVSAGRYLSCGVDADGRAFCWGEPLGAPSGYGDTCLHGRPCSFAPVPLLPKRRFAALDARSRCAVDAAGTALCWGHDFRTAARPEEPWPDAGVTTVAGDPEDPSYCALDRDGRALCVGEPDFGIAGTGGRDSASLGRPAEHAAPFTDVAVLWRWACALDAAGAAWCWGAAGYDDATRDGTSRPGLEQCDRWGTRTWCNTRPAAVSGGLRFRSLAAMPRGTMPVTYEMVGLTAEGEAYAWGGFREPRPWHPEQRWTSVAAGDWGQCGVTTGGELFCWGRDPHEEVQGRIPHPAAR
jgi:hypothetical protein